MKKNNTKELEAGKDYLADGVFIYDEFVTFRFDKGCNDLCAVDFPIPRLKNLRLFKKDKNHYSFNVDGSYNILIPVSLDVDSLIHLFGEFNKENEVSSIGTIKKSKSSKAEEVITEPAETSQTTEEEKVFETTEEDAVELYKEKIDYDFSDEELNSDDLVDAKEDDDEELYVPLNKKKIIKTLILIGSIAAGIFIYIKKFKKNK